MKIIGSQWHCRFQSEADAAIWNGHYQTFGWPERRATGQPPEEDFVAALILKTFPDLARRWRPLFRELGIRMTIIGVFCHQTPKARFGLAGATVSPELADLLIVRKHKTRVGHTRQAAVLIQAKMAETGEIVLPGNDPQLYLMTMWPEFNVLGRNAPAQSFSLGCIASQANYSGVRRRSPDPSENGGWPGFCPWALALPSQRTWVRESLSDFLLRMLDFEAGREFFETNHTGCDWTTLIHYLLRTTFELPLRTRDMDPRAPRGTTSDLDRMGFAEIDPGLGSEFLPRDRIAELGGGTDIPQDFPVNWSDRPGEGRVIVIETDEGHG